MGLKVFNFICENGHTFEAMVPSIEAFEEQKKNGFFTCPVCNSNVISRALSAPHIQASSTQKDVSQNTVEAMHTVYKTVKKILDESENLSGIDLPMRLAPFTEETPRTASSPELRPRKRYQNSGMKELKF